MFNDPERRQKFRALKQRAEQGDTQARREMETMLRLHADPMGDNWTGRGAPEHQD